MLTLLFFLAETSLHCSLTVVHTDTMTGIFGKTCIFRQQGFDTLSSADLRFRDFTSLTFCGPSSAT
jgi:hypothetical protein